MKSGLPDDQYFVAIRTSRLPDDIEKQPGFNPVMPEAHYVFDHVFWRVARG
jgi:hypothetical protein